MKHKIRSRWDLTRIFLLLLLSFRMTPGQNFQIERFSTGPGGMTTGGTFVAWTVIGEPDPGTLTGGNFVAEGGFLSILLLNESYWLPTNSGKWEVSQNWSLGEPKPSHSLHIINTNSKSVLLDVGSASGFGGTMRVRNLVMDAPAGATNILLLSNASQATPLQVTNEVRLQNNCSLVIDNSAFKGDGPGGLIIGSQVPGPLLTNSHIIITNGGKLFTTETIIGGLYGYGDDVVVAGPNSLWTNSARIFITLTTPGTGLTVAKGGQLISGNNVYIGYGGNSGGTEALVTDPGSRWINLGTLYVGSSSHDVHFTISNGASAFSANAVIGFPAANNQTVLVTGAGSMWTSDGTIVIGSDISGPGTGLAIREGAAVTVANGNGTGALIVKHGTLGITNGLLQADNLILGDCANAVSGTVAMSNGGMYVTNAFHTGVLNLRAGTFTQTGGTLVVDRLILTNSCASFNRMGGTLVYNQLVLDPSSDTDGDGQSNANESVAGTDPLSANSVFRITAALRANNDVQLEWTTVGGHKYVVQTSTNLTENFVDLSNVLNVGGQGQETITYVHSGGATNRSRFYRVRLVP